MEFTKLFITAKTFFKSNVNRVKMALKLNSYFNDVPLISSFFVGGEL